MSFWRSTDPSWRLAHLQGVMVPVEPSSLRSDLEEPTKDDPEMQKDTNNFNIISINAGICPRKCAINVWHHHILAKTILWQNDILATWYCGKTILWQNDILAIGKMILWQKNILAKNILGYTLAAFQTNTLFKANDFANWLTKEPQFEWQKNHFWSSPEKPQQEHHEANGPPRSPNHVLLSLIWIYWYDMIRLRRTVRCAKGGGRLGCVLSSRVPGRRDAAVHEHASKSCAAHTGFPCKDHSAKLEFEMFWSWNHVS